MGYYKTSSMPERGVSCPSCGRIYVNTVKKPGNLCSCGDIFELYEDVIVQKIPICGCGRVASERYSFGISAGLYCDECWRSSGYRDIGPEGFDPLDAGETYEPEPEVS